jgi:methyl coenzyme M reductase alpha subunit
MSDCPNCGAPEIKNEIYRCGSYMSEGAGFYTYPTCVYVAGLRDRATRAEAAIRLACKEGNSSDAMDGLDEYLKTLDANDE